MLENYFHPTNQSKIVSLENSALRKKCGNELSNVALSLTGSTMPENSMNQLKKVNSKSIGVPDTALKVFII